MANNWKEHDVNKVEPKKAKNHCQMHNCRALIKYKCTPTAPEGSNVTVTATPIFVCEKDMPHWRDKYYHIAPATKIS